MKKIFMTLCLIGGLAILFSCNDDSSSYPIPTDIQDLKATPAPGQITLSWTLPEDANLYYVQVEYVVEGKPYKKQVSQYANELVIDNLLQKYGEITFTVQVFNRGNTAGASHQITAQAEKAKPTFGTPVKLELDADKIWTNAPFPTRAVKFLVDELTDNNHFFHSWWSDLVEMPHYLVIDLKEEVSAIKIRSTNTARANDSSWKVVNLYTSDSYDPSAWFDGKKKIDGNSVDISAAGTRLETTLTEIPAGLSEIYNSEIIPLSKPSRYLWFEVTETAKGTPYFALAELELYSCSMVVPE